MEGLPKLSDLFRKPGPVIETFLGHMESIYGCWYPLQPTGEANQVASTLRFREMRVATPSLSCKLNILGEGDEFRGRIHPVVGRIGATSFFGGPCGSLDHSAVLVPPIWFGEDTTVRSGGKIIGPVLIGEKSHFDTGVVFKRSIVGKNSRIDAQAVVIESLIGSGVYIMSHVSCMHQVGLNDEPIVVREMRASAQFQRSFSLRRHRMGCVIGDDCVIEAGVVLHPGTVLMPGTRVPKGRRLSSGIYDQSAVDSAPLCSQQCPEPDPMNLRLD